MKKNISSKKRLIALAALIASLGVSGCISVLPEPEQPKALVRLPTSGIRGANIPLDTNIVVHTPDAMGAISGVEIASAEDQRIRYINDVRWADSPTRLFQEAVVEALTASEGQGHAVPVQVGARGDYDLRLSLLDLTIDNKNEIAVCEARLVLTRTGDKDIIATEVIRATEALRGKESLIRAEALALAIQKTSELAADFVALNAVPYDLVAERSMRRDEKRLERQAAKKQLEAEEELKTTPTQPEEDTSEFPSEVRLETDV